MAKKENPRFTCMRCAHCCFFSHSGEAPTVFPWEKRVLEAEAKKRGISGLLRTGFSFEPLIVYHKNNVCAVLLYRMKIEGFCPFFDIATRSCIIHERKPLACKLFPLFAEVNTGRVSVSLKCKWVNLNKELLGRLSNTNSIKAHSLLRRIFPSEYFTLMEVIELFTFLRESLDKKGFKPLHENDVCNRFIDADIIVGKGEDLEA